MAKRVLVIDNDPDCLDMVKETLLYEGFEVCTGNGNGDMRPGVVGVNAQDVVPDRSEFGLDAGAVFFTAGRMPEDCKWQKFSKSPLQNFDKGKYLFGRDCIACHTIGHGDKIGPDLLGVIHVRSRQWLTQIIQHPDQLFEEKDPIATALLKKYSVRMPNNASLISSQDIFSLREATAANSFNTWTLIHPPSARSFSATTPRGSSEEIA